MIKMSRINQTSAAPRRAVVMLLLVLALVMPRVSGVLVDLLPGFERTVICTGSEMLVLTLDDAGEPVTVSEEAGGPCLRATSAPALAQHAPAPYLAELAFAALFPVKLDLLAPRASLRLQREKRGPPSLI